MPDKGHHIITPPDSDVHASMPRMRGSASLACCCWQIDSLSRLQSAHRLRAHTWAGKYQKREVPMVMYSSRATTCAPPQVNDSTRKGFLP